MKRNKLFKITIILILIISISGCKLGKKEQDNKNKITEDAIKYIEKKYNKDFKVNRSGYVMTNSTLFPTYSDDVEIELTDGTKILYSAENNKFYDDYQAEKISKALIEEIWNPMLVKLEPYKLSYEVKPAFNLYNKEGLTGTFFHEHYNGNIENFIKNEKLSVDIGHYDEYDNWIESYIYIISEDKDSWQERFNTVENTIKTYFKGQNDSSLQLIALTSNLYEEVKPEGYYDIKINMDGCWAKGNNKNLYLQKYIKVSDGIYITSSESNFNLEEGDITLKEVMTGEELQNIMDVVAKEKAGLDEHYQKYEKNKYKINYLTPVYEFVFSERIQKKYEEYGSDAFMSVYIKFIPEELNISDNNNLYAYPIRYGKIDNYYNDIVSQGNKKEAGTEMLYIFKKDHKDYYWIGTQTTEEIIK